jgi:hypothetical protein
VVHLVHHDVIEVVRGELPEVLGPRQRGHRRKDAVGFGLELPHPDEPRRRVGSHPDEGLAGLPQQFLAVGQEQDPTGGRTVKSSQVGLPDARRRDDEALRLALHPESRQRGQGLALRGIRHRTRRPGGGFESQRARLATSGIGHDPVAIHR